MKTLLSIFFSNDYTLKEKISASFWILAGSAMIAFFGYIFLIAVIWGRPSAQENADQEAHVECQLRITAEWAINRSRDGNIRELLEFIDDHVWGSYSEYHGKGSGTVSLFTDYPKLAAGARLFGLTEEELSNLDQQVYDTCGPFPRYETRWGGRVKIR